MTVAGPSDSQGSPHPWNYAWGVLLAYGLLFAGVFALLARGTAGPRFWSFEELALMSAIGTFVGLQWGLALPAWLILIGGIYRNSTSRRFRLWLAIAPSLLFVMYQTGILASNPPTPEKYFLRTFGVELPADAKTLEVAHATLADAGLVDFAFTCSSQGLRELIAKMNLDPVTTEPRPLVTRFRVGHSWHWYDWRTPHQYAKTLRSGVGYILVADTEMQRALVVRDPLFAKSAEEDPNGTFKD